MTRIPRTVSLCLAVAALTLGLTPASAWALNVPFYVQDFDGLTLGSFPGQDGWSGGAGTVQNTTVVSGQAVEVTAGTIARSNIFAPLATQPRQEFRVDLRLESDIHDFAGQLGVNIQHSLLFRGPDINKQFVIVYSGLTNNTDGAVTQSRWEIRGNNTTTTLNTVVENVWYSFSMLMNFNTNTIDTVILADGLPFATLSQSGFQGNGNVNNVNIDSDGTPDVDFFMDNFGVFIPEPASAGVMGLLGLAMLARRRK